MGLAGGVPSGVLAVPRGGCYGTALAGPAIVAAAAPPRPLKSGDFLPRFYGPICLRRALPPAINHSALGGSGERGVAGRMPVVVALPMAPAKTTSSWDLPGPWAEPCGAAGLAQGPTSPAGPFPANPLDPLTVEQTRGWDFGANHSAMGNSRGRPTGRAVLPMPGLQEGPRSLPGCSQRPEASGWAQRRRRGLGAAVTFAIQSISWVLLSSPPCPTFLAGSLQSLWSWGLCARQDDVPGPRSTTPRAEERPVPQHSCSRQHRPAGTISGIPRPVWVELGSAPGEGGPGCATVDALPGAPVSGRAGTRQPPAAPRHALHCPPHPSAAPPGVCSGWALGTNRGCHGAGAEAGGGSPEPRSQRGPPPLAGAHLAAAAARPVPLSLNQFGGLLKRCVSVWRINCL